jgi:hypothetical protein
MNPKVLVTGHPNSGTSFLCNLVAEMGFSPGDRALLKPPDAHNPHGYWEHAPLQDYVRALSGYGDWMHVTGGYPPEPLNFTAEEKRRTESLFGGAGVEVFKETGLPIMYRLFPPDSKYIFISRGKLAMYESQGANYKERGISFDDFSQNVDIYQGLLSRMERETASLIVRYDDFRENLDTVIWGIAAFLGIEPDIPRLREIWRPRR